MAKIIGALAEVPDPASRAVQVTELLRKLIRVGDVDRFSNRAAPDRTDEEIMASNIANQERKDALRAEQERIAEEKKDMYRALGRATGIDVEAMEAEIEAERAAEEAELADEAVSSSAVSEASLAE